MDGRSTSSLCPFGLCLWTSLGDLCQCSSTYMARKLFYFHLNGVLCISICTHYLLPVLSLGTPEKSLALSSFLAISSIYTHWWDHLELHLLQVEQSQLSHILLLCQIHQSLNHPHWVHGSYTGESSTRHSTPGVSCWCWAEKKDQLLWPSSSSGLCWLQFRVFCVLRQ